MKKLMLLLLLFTSCVSDYDRIQDAKKKFPGYEVVPIIPGNNGTSRDYDLYLVSPDGTWLGVDYWFWSTERIDRVHRLIYQYRVQPSVHKVSLPPTRLDTLDEIGRTVNRWIDSSKEQ